MREKGQAKGQLKGPTPAPWAFSRAFSILDTAKIKNKLILSFLYRYAFLYKKGIAF